MVQRAYRYRFYPDAEQEQLLRRTLGCTRLVYNKALAARTEGWYERKERIGYTQTSSMLTQWKKQEGLKFLNEVSSVALQQALRHLHRAFVNFWANRSRYPRFKKKSNGGSAEFTRSAFKWANGQLKLAKTKNPLNIVWSRPIPQGCVPTTVTLKLEPSNRWFVTFLVDDSTVVHLPPSQNKVGLDMGLSILVTTSNGEKIANPRHFNQKFKRLKAAQKSLSRKKLKSNNRRRARLKVAKAHAKIADARRDFLHKLTTNLIRENQTIVVEDLAVRNMVKNRSLARSISDASWGEFVRQLQYKSEWYGRELIKIDRFFPSSKRCGNCGFILDKLPLNIREWECPQCKTTHDRDINAAKNILAAGLAVSVCGANVRPDRLCSKGQLRNSRKGKKQKPK